jgi:hypothetical protein
MIVLERVAEQGEAVSHVETSDAWHWAVALLTAELERVPAPDRRTLIDTLLEAEGTPAQRQLARDIAARAGVGSLDAYLPMMFPDAD